jgi:hypothetical protein
MDQLSFVGRIDRAGGDRVHEPRTFSQRAGRLHGTPFVPEQDDDHGEDKHEAERHSANRLFHTIKPRDRDDFF